MYVSQSPYQTLAASLSLSNVASPPVPTDRHDRHQQTSGVLSSAVAQTSEHASLPRAELVVTNLRIFFFSRPNIIHEGVPKAAATADCSPIRAGIRIALISG
jgi:hypothetical protein